MEEVESLSPPTNHSATTAAANHRHHGVEQVQILDPNNTMDHHSNVDTSRPFRSVKEAVAIFGDRILVGPNTCSLKPFSIPTKETSFSPPSPKVDNKSSWKYSKTPSPADSNSRDYNQDTILADTVKKLEIDLKETKNELKLLKERETKTEVALASLNAEFHKNMSKLAPAEAAKAAACSRSASARGEDIGDKVIRRGDDEKILFHRIGSNPSPSLAQIMSVGQEEESLFIGSKNEMKLVKKKPIIPLVKDLFSRKKGSSNTLDNPLYASSPLKWN